ncbi:hypothetical protein [Zhouia amylolytica]|uniref:hypothetical protein n=1 Tax=Zhouia amylolytica TaxID=376730 RepID=UPI00056E7BC9|nr:hypothetical protein [Zhouia amylolytica]
MNSNEEQLIKDLKRHAKDHTPTLQPHSFFNDRFQVTCFYVKNHEDLLLSVRSLLYLCKRILDPEDDMEKAPEWIEKDYIRQALSIANRLMPLGDEALLGHINSFYQKEN